jgi:small subunit ribosomal protein S18
MTGFKLKVSSRLLKKRQRKQSFLPPKQCRFCASTEYENQLDYKNTEFLRGFLTERCKILSSHVSGNCAYHQRRLSEKIKLSRTMALLPYCLMHR